jgi:hypothetical protein
VICLAPAEELGSRSIHPRGEGGFMMRRWTAIVAMLATIALGVAARRHISSGGRWQADARRRAGTSLSRLR